MSYGPIYHFFAFYFSESQFATGLFGKCNKNYLRLEGVDILLVSIYISLGLRTQVLIAIKEAINYDCALIVLLQHHIKITH